MNDATPHHIPFSWKWTTLGNIAEIVRSQVNPGLKPQEKFNYLSIENVEANSGELVNFAPVRGEKIKSAKIAFTTNDVLYSKLRPYLNKVHLPIFDGISATDLIPIRPLGGIPREYLGYFLRTRSVVDYANQRMRGIQLPRIPVDDILKLPFPVAPLPEQKRIVEKIEETFRETRVAKKALENLPPVVRQFRQSFLSKVFRGELIERAPNEGPAEKLLEEIRRGRRRNWEEDPRSQGRDGRKFEFAELEPPNVNELPKLPADWVWVRLGRLSELRNGKSLTEKNRIGTGNVPVYGGNGYVGNHSRSLVDHPTIVIGRVGANCGNVHLTPGPAWITDNAIFVSCVDQQVELEYLTYFLRQRRLNDLSGGTGQPYVSQELLYPLPIPLPPITEQRLIVTKIKELLAKADIVEQCASSGLKRISILEQLILSRAFLGELVPQDPNDELASVLLEKIRAKREAIGKKGKRASHSRVDKVSF